MARALKLNDDVFQFAKTAGHYIPAVLSITILLALCIYCIIDRAGKTTFTANALICKVLLVAQALCAILTSLLKPLLHYIKHHNEKKDVQTGKKFSYLKGAAREKALAYVKRKYEVHVKKRLGKQPYMLWALFSLILTLILLYSYFMISRSQKYKKQKYLLFAPIVLSVAALVRFLLERRAPCSRSTEEGFIALYSFDSKAHFIEFGLLYLTIFVCFFIFRRISKTEPVPENRCSSIQY